MNNNLLSNQPDEIDIQLNLAHDYQIKGKLELAIGVYQKILLQHPDCIVAYLALGTLLIGQGRFSEAIVLCKKAISLMPNQPEFHKNLINALVLKDGIEQAFEHYELTRADTKEIEINPSDILCYIVIRNELMRLPYLLSYYREKGISKFLIVDNNSTDGSLAYLLEQPDVYTWHSTYSFNQANFGSAWLELLLRKYGVYHWCLIVDADEIFYYPNCERRNIVHLCQELDQKQKTVFNVVLLDMYSDKAIKDTHYISGQNFLEVCNYFDRDFYHEKKEDCGTYRNQNCYWGGVRERIFGPTVHCLLSKVALIKYNVNFIVASGQHWTNRPKHEIADSSGCLLHFKFFSNFSSYVEQEIKRKEHWHSAREYVEYAQGINKNENLVLYDQQYSVKLQDSQQLVELGIMQLGEPSSVEVAIEFPKIDSITTGISRPFWSVMISAHQGVNYLTQALKSVLEQAHSVDEMQIEVVNDATSNEAEIAEIIEALGDKRIHFYQHPKNIGHPQIFNICIQRAIGQWVHILDAAHEIKPGFYRHLQAGIEKEESFGAAFCRHIHVNRTGNVCKISPLERETPGVITDWLERIAVMCRLQLPSVVVKRDVYEKLGGFCQEANSAFDWEMWKRIAAHYPVWYEPLLLVNFRENFGAESTSNINSSIYVADSLKAIEISQVYLEGEIGRKLTNRARENCALSAFYSAQQQLQKGDYQTAIANLREGLKCSQSPRVKQALILLLLQTESIIGKSAMS